MPDGVDEAESGHPEDLDAAGNDDGAPPLDEGPPSDAELAALRQEAARWRAGVPAVPNLIRKRPVGDDREHVPLDPGLADALGHPAAKEAMARLQSTRGRLTEQLEALRHYADAGGVTGHLQERARLLEVRSNDPVWLVVEAALDSAYRVSGGLEVFSESLGVYLDYEFTKVRLYDAVLGKLGETVKGQEALREELAQTQASLAALQEGLKRLEANQYEALQALPEFSRKAGEGFVKALEAGKVLSGKAEAGTKRLDALQAWVKAAVVVGMAATVVGLGVAWLLISRWG
jgi:hypothetical protein